MNLTSFTVLCLFFCLATSLTAAEPDLNELITTPEATAPKPANPLCSAYNTLNDRIRDGLVGKTAARSELVTKLADIRAEYYKRGGKDYASAEWVFPLAGYNIKAIEGGHNHGYIPGGYDFFSGNRHGGHPAYDIFIHDRNQDSFDDQSGTTVKVLSLTGGIVVALEKRWEQGSGLRGGKYIWIYDPANDLLVYYAHNRELLVELGSIVKPGDLLATVGRSGLNAAKHRSPTHLHFSVLKLKDGQPVPLPVYHELQKARIVPAGGI